MMQNNNQAEEFIYNTLREKSIFPYSKELCECIENTAKSLLSSKPNAKEPVLLLGKIQCGKTNTFENIIGLCFDHGIDVCVVMTKGTKTLASQTINRLLKDFRWFKSDGTLNQKGVVEIYDILERFKKNGLQESVTKRAKIIIVCKKETTNIKHLINLFNVKSPYLKKKKVLVVDDEADFASCNFRKIRNISSMAKISSQIMEFLTIPEYCRYLQVTATPYALYLQPNGYINLNADGLVPHFKPRRTVLVPVHDKYVGGIQYFEKSEDGNSLYSNLFVPVDEKCITIMGKKNERYTNTGIASDNLKSITKTLVYYFTAAAIRSVQKEKQNLICQTSCLIHVDTDKDAHEWQKKLSIRLIDDIKRGFLYEINDKADLRLEEMYDIAYDDFKESNQKAKNEGIENIDLPSKREVRDRIIRIFNDKDYSVNIINSDHEVSELLNKDTGQLNLNNTANIFIGGSILDRGITIDNMLCFFYGRDPKNFQMDTVLQHARMYGNRSKEDMAVTRFFTTNSIYIILKRIHQIDEDLRQRLSQMVDDEDIDGTFATEFIGYDKHIKPCADSKIKFTNISMIKPTQRIVPIGFQTGTKNVISKTIDEIDSIIKSAPGFVKNSFFEMDSSLAKDIIIKIRSTFIYDDTPLCTFNKGLEWDENEMLAAIEYSLKGKDSQKVLIHYADNRNMSRVRENGKYIDAPDDGNNDTAPSRAAATDYPVLMLLRQNGLKKDGWRDTPFYWPVLIVPQRIKKVMYALNGAVLKDKEIITDEGFGINPDGENVLRLTLASEPFWNILFGLKDIELRDIDQNTASRYIEQSPTSPVKYKIRTDIPIDESQISGIESYNNGVFPFVLRKFDYILFRNSHDHSGSLLLVKLWPYTEDSIVHYSLMNDTDNLADMCNNVTPYSEKTICNWGLEYPIDSVVGYKLNKADQSRYEIIKAQYLEGKLIKPEDVPLIENKKIDSNDNSETVVGNNDDIQPDQTDRLNKVELDVKHSEQPSQTLRITCPDGLVIESHKATATFVEAVLKAGVERVNRLGIERCGVALIAPTKDAKYNQTKLESGEYLFTNLSTSDKKKVLDTINAGLKLGWRVELVEKKALYRAFPHNRL
ncbi:MAG: hypothetical protein J6Y82_02925 [Bacteroidales bacterium]|nr:hypothetical protein [Bacteroidales bacterium]